MLKRETFETAILKAKEVSPDQLAVLVMMQQLSNPNNAVNATLEEKTKHLNKLSKGKRYTKQKVEALIEESIREGLLPSDSAVLPMIGMLSDIEEEDADHWIARYESHGRPELPDLDGQRQDFVQVISAFMATRMEMAVCSYRQALLEDSDGNTILSNAAVKKYKKKEWDFGFLRKLMNQYGAELVTKTLCRIHIEMPHLVDNFQKLVPSEKQKASRGLLISLLQGDSLPEEHDIFDEF